jgi:hypothetical protein
MEALIFMLSMPMMDVVGGTVGAVVMCFVGMGD